MTTEIAIMNKGAIALAADSAVTIGNGNKFYNTANKLFTLSKYHPVGIMVYSNADFMGYPMETIIKEYRKELGNKSFPRLEDYWDDFIRYLENVYSKDNGLDDFYSEIISFISFLDEEIKTLNNEKIELYQENNRDGESPINTLIMAHISKESINEVINQMYTLYSSYEDEEDFIVHKDTINDAIEDEVSNIVEHIIGLVDEENITKIISLCTMILTKKHNNGSRTGVVIAGFGEKDMFPSLVSASLMGVYFNSLKINNKNIARIDNNHEAGIFPFAQGDVISTFMTGIDNDLKKYILSKIEQYDIHKCENENCVNNLKNEISSIIDNWSENYHIDPIMNTVSVAPKEELSQMAETLVNLTSFRRKLSMDAFSQSVGGPIDVALITKGDGFIWIKRKYYFEMNKNPHFLENYYRNC